MPLKLNKISGLMIKREEPMTYSGNQSDLQAQGEREIEFCKGEAFDLIRNMEWFMRARIPTHNELMDVCTLLANNLDKVIKYKESK